VVSEVVSAPGVRVGTACGKFVVIFAKGDQHFASRRRIPRSEGQANSVSDDQDAAVSVPDDGSETLPISALRIPPRARLPMTIKPAPTSSPRSTISLSGRPLTRCCFRYGHPFALDPLSLSVEKLLGLRHGLLELAFKHVGRDAAFSEHGSIPARYRWASYPNDRALASYPIECRGRPIRPQRR
jgi:hypothetical protein